MNAFITIIISYILLSGASQSGDHICVHGQPLATKAYVMNPRFSTPTSLPLYFFLEYKALQENEEFMKKCGKVSSFYFLLTQHSTQRHSCEEKRVSCR